MPQLKNHFRHDTMASTIKYVEEYGGITTVVIKTSFKSPIFNTNNIEI